VALQAPAVAGVSPLPLKGGRKDGICLGMFPKARDEIAENARLTRALSVARAASPGTGAVI